ncbi:MAG: DUF4173 domain-containing protein [Defluviitaleaceae bacterium]|nr:DUF4173 domain-containing protein [Defluviitaleaceae bacterium]
MDLYIARHGETQFNVEGRMQGQGKDSPLTTRGRAQAQALGKTLEAIKRKGAFDAVYSSTAKRASDTAEIALGVKPILDPRLVEIGLGDMEGMQYQEGAEAFPETAASRQLSPVDYIPPPNGETLPDMVARVSSFLEDCTAHNKVFVLTHAYTMRVFHACITEKNNNASISEVVTAIAQAPRFNNCDVAHFKFENDEWRLVSVTPLELPTETKVQPVVEDWQRVISPQKRFVLETDKSLAPTFALFAFITALLYTISFTGIRVYPQLSFFVFCSVTLILLYVLLRRLGWIRHPRAFLWGIPLMILACFNLVFGRSAFTYINVVAVWVLFAFIIYGAIHGAKYPFGALSFWVNIAKVIRGHLTAGICLVMDTSKNYKLTKNHPAMRFLLGIAIALPLLAIIMALMISADQVFATILRDFFEGDGDFDFARFFGHIIVTVIASVFAAGYVYKAKFMAPSDATFKPFNLDKIIALAFLSAINLLFLAFCYIQLAYLFMGGFGTLPGDIVFADYARQGFFQLLFIIVINFSVIIIFIQVFSHHARVGAVRLMLTLLTLFTGMLIASSFYRMNMYMRVFGFTPLRMSVITFLVMSVLLCMVTLIALFKEKFDVMRTYLIIGMVFLVLANVSGSGFLSGRLNAHLYRNSNEYHFTMRDHFWDADNASSLIEIYHLTGNDSLRADIRWRLVAYYWQYIDEPWQNRSIIKRANLRQIEAYFGPVPVPTKRDL